MICGENVTEVKMGAVDRISELPDFILHTILSNMDTHEAGRSSVLSKRWYLAWSSIPVLDFHARYFNTDQCLFDFIDKTMQRYSTHKYRITKMYLMLQMHDYEKLKPLLDKWITIAVQNQIQKLDILILNLHDVAKYMLPEILFSAKSLKNLKCWGVGLPYYETMELISLEHFKLSSQTVDEDMLQRIISFCPLVELKIACPLRVFVNVSPLWMRKFNLGAAGRDSGAMQSDLQVSPLQKFVYNCYSLVNLWPWNINMAALKNLRKLEIRNAFVTDDIVSELVCGLVALESLILHECSMLNHIKISSVSLKDLCISAGGFQFTKVTIDAPNLLEFQYRGNVETAVSLVRSLDRCNAQCFPMMMQTVTTDWLVKLKRFLIETKYFRSLVLDIFSHSQIEIEEEQLRNVVIDPPYKLRELKLHGTVTWDLTESALVAFLDGLFWSCQPDVLSIPTNLQNSAAKLILNILEKKARCWKDPLKSVEVEDVEFPRLLSCSFELEIRLRLSW